MRRIRSLIAAFAFVPATLHPPADLPNLGRPATIGVLLERATASRLISGGVVVVGNRDGIVTTVARGTRTGRPDSQPLDERTMFDIASLTKVVATAPSVMKLVDEGKVGLGDPLSRWLPEFRGARSGEITILDLLTHTSGLADFNLRRGESILTAVRKAAREKHCVRAGASFNYADINFILLGEVVRRASGKTLDQFSREEIFTPLGLRETMFLPPRDAAPQIAPTLGFTSGVVEDGNARRLGGVAGHAGVFSSAADLARYARLLLAGGTLDGRRILSPGIVREMTVPRTYCGGEVVRGLGWDIETRFSAPRGNFFSRGSFGHTGYSGSSIWIDPDRDLFVIVLTNRLNYRDTKIFNRLRSDISTVAAAEAAVQQQGIGIAEVAAIAADADRYDCPVHPRPHVVQKKGAKHPVRVAMYRQRVKGKKIRKV